MTAVIFEKHNRCFDHNQMARLKIAKDFLGLLV